MIHTVVTAGDYHQGMSDPTTPPAGPACPDHPDFQPDSLRHLREHLEDYHPAQLAAAEGEPDTAADDAVRRALRDG